MRLVKALQGSFSKRHYIILNSIKLCPDPRSPFALYYDDLGEWRRYGYHKSVTAAEAGMKHREELLANGKTEIF